MFLVNAVYENEVWNNKIKTANHLDLIIVETLSLSTFPTDYTYG